MSETLLDLVLAYKRKMKKHGNSKFTEAERFDIYKRVKEGAKQVDIANELKVDASTITGIVNEGIEREIEMYRINKNKTK